MKINDEIEDKYLFKLKILNNKMTVLNYINKVIEFERKEKCHVDNKQFHSGWIAQIEDI